MAIVITGSPGVGKHTLAKRIATYHNNTNNLELFDINAVALQGQQEYLSKGKGQKVKRGSSKTSVSSKTTPRESIDIDTAKLKRKVRKLIDKDSLVVGHLAPYVVPEDKADVVIVLRKSPYKLQRVYARRNYDYKKSLDNLQSEILGIIYYDCVKSFGLKKTYSMDVSNRTIKQSTEILCDITSNSKMQRKKQQQLFEKGDMVDWLGMVEKKGDLTRFFPS